MTEAALLSQSKTRLALVAGAFMLGYLAVGLRLADLTLLRAPPVAEEKTEADVRPLARPLRGDILDRNGELIATSLKMNSVYADTTLVQDPAALAKALSAALPDLDRAAAKKKLASGKKFVWIRRDVTPRQAFAVNAIGDPALGFQEEDRRLYPGGSLAAHVAGYTDVDGAGIAGAEKAFEKRLREGAAPVRLTLDLRVQHILRHALEEAVRKTRAQAAAGIVMDARTGEIIAMVSLPDFDPARPGEAPDKAKFNRAALGVFEMGSTFKTFSTAAALDSGRVGFASTFDAAAPIRYGRFTISDFHPKARVLSVPEIFIYSSNIGAARMALTLGPQALEAFYRRLGFAAPAPLELPETGAPLWPSAWRDVQAMTAAFGHGIAVSPVQLARAGAAVVNGGILVTPTLELKEGREPGPRVMSASTSARMRQLMELNVAAGSGKRAHVDGYGVGGKTGTAEKIAGGRYTPGTVLSSFLGVFPVRAPRYIVLAIVDEPQPVNGRDSVTGGVVAAPAVGEVVSRMAPLYRMTPELDAGHDIVQDMAAWLQEPQKGTVVAAHGTD